MGTIFDLDRPVMSTNPPTAYSTPLAARSFARASCSAVVALTVSIDLLGQGWGEVREGGRAERRLLHAAALDAVGQRGDREVQQPLAELEGRLRRTAGDAVRRQGRRGVAEHELAGAVR